MPFSRPSVRSVLRPIAILLLAAPATVAAETLTEPLEGMTVGGVAARSTFSMPAPRALPDLLPLRMTAAPSTLPSFDLSPLQFSSAIGPKGPVDASPTGFSARLMSRMSLEARRYRRDNVSESTGFLRNDRSDDLDSIAEARRNSEASRVITRSFHRALDEELERAARTTLGLGSALDFLRGASLRGARPGQSARGDGSTGAAPGQRAEGLRGDVGLRLDAHPALVLRARLGALRGRLELPARDEPARLTVESPIGQRGRAVLSAAQPRDGQASTTLTFNFWF